MTAIDPARPLAGQVAWVTGASRGLGQAMAVALARAGADVAIAARSVDALADTQAQIESLGRRALPLALDVSHAAQCAPAAAEVAAWLGRLDILVNNAGVEEVRASLDVDEALWDRILDTNLKGAFFCAQAAARTMAARGEGGAIVNVCSLTSVRGIPTAVPYGASKSGLLGMTRALAAEWAPRGIRVNGLAPGYFRTALTEAFYQDEAWQQRMLERIPMKRFGQGDDLAGAVVFLASGASAYLTGQCLFLDGGTTAAL